jgi:CheY-like chemotaxis protein
MSTPQPVNSKEQQPPLQENLPHGSIQKRIMVVDDDLDIVTALQSALIKAGFFIAAYTNSRKALSDYKPHDYDLVLLDVRMPGMSGYELYAELKKLDASIKVIFLTAFDVQQEIVKLFPSSM